MLRQVRDRGIIRRNDPKQHRFEGKNGVYEIRGTYLRLLGRSFRQSGETKKRLVDVALPFKILHRNKTAKP